MAYSSDEINEIKAKVDIALNGGGLNAWQVQFLSDIKNRIEKYGTKTFLSDKQVSKFHEITAARKAHGNFTRPRPIRNPRPFRLRTFSLPRRFRLPRKSYAPVAQSRFAIVLALIVAGILFSLTQNPSVPTESSYLSTVPRSNTAVPITNRQFSVTDGDTIQLSGEARGLRLVGLNAPETFEPKCARERELGNRAKARLKELVKGENLTLIRIACSCAPGTEGTTACNYGRSCGRLLVNGRDVGKVLISEGLAVRFECGPTSCPPTPRPWCT